MSDFRIKGQADALGEPSNWIDSSESPTHSDTVGTNGLLAVELRPESDHTATVTVTITLASAMAYSSGALSHVPTCALSHVRRQQSTNLIPSSPANAVNSSVS